MPNVSSLVWKFLFFIYPEDIHLHFYSCIFKYTRLFIPLKNIVELSWWTLCVGFWYMNRIISWPISLYIYKRSHSITGSGSSSLTTHFLILPTEIVIFFLWWFFFKERICCVVWVFIFLLILSRNYTQMFRCFPPGWITKNQHWSWYFVCR